jgi:Tfp pilus assembly protein PilF
LDNRTEILKQMLDADPTSSFARYGLAMEYVKAGSYDAALVEFRTLLGHDPAYSAAYFHGGQTSEKKGDTAGARDFYRRGLENTRDAHARAEMQGALDILGE